MLISTEICPTVGSSPRRTAKMYFRISARKKIGIHSIFFLALILKYIFAVRLGLLPTVGQISVLINIPHPTNFYLLDALLAGNLGAFWDVLNI